VTRALADVAELDVVPSAANFLWLGTRRPAAQVQADLLQRGVLVRSFHASGGRMAHRMRVTIGSPVENDLFLAALPVCLEGA
jgi:histidinol-phosphate aminotransferase